MSFRLGLGLGRVLEPEIKLGNRLVWEITTAIIQGVGVVHPTYFFQTFLIS